MLLLLFIKCFTGVSYGARDQRQRAKHGMVPALKETTICKRKLTIKPSMTERIAKEYGNKRIRISLLLGVRVSWGRCFRDSTAW